MTVIALPEGFDLDSAVEAGVKAAFAEAAKLKALKEKPLLTDLEVETLYGFKQETLKAWRRTGKGPRFCQRDKSGPVRYTHDAIEEFMTSARPQTCQETE